jgi:hypothetical protein
MFADFFVDTTITTVIAVAVVGIALALHTLWRVLRS